MCAARVRSDRPFRIPARRIGHYFEPNYQSLFASRVLLFIVCLQGRLLSSVKDNCFLLTLVFFIVDALSIVFNQYVSLKHLNVSVILYN